MNTVSLSQVRKLRHRELKEFVQGHMHVSDSSRPQSDSILMAILSLFPWLILPILRGCLLGPKSILDRGSCLRSILRTPE